MCLVTVYTEDNGEKQEVMRDVAWIECKDDGLLMVRFLGEERWFRNRIESIDLVNNSVVLKGGDFRDERR